MSSSDSRVDVNYVKSVPGLIRIAQLVVAICGLISAGSGYYCFGTGGKIHFYEFTAVYSLIFVILVFILFFFRIDQAIGTRINIPLSLLINDAILTILYLIAAILMFVAIGACDWGVGGRVAAAIFGVLGFLTHGYHAFLDYGWVRGRTSSPSQPAGNKGDPA
ncbi:uncharacterized protein LOC143246990 [Tachypleus tridentatus]|uniref:uncharacterized protein LOC143246990 n=1 Tax=Tachypleus tridentatus TaxID=6853 RepID=UPI003FD26387